MATSKQTQKILLVYLMFVLSFGVAITWKKADERYEQRKRYKASAEEFNRISAQLIIERARKYQTPEDADLHTLLQQEPNQRGV